MHLQNQDAVGDACACAFITNAATQGTPAPVIVKLQSIP